MIPLMPFLNQIKAALATLESNVKEIAGIAQVEKEASKGAEK